MEDTLLVRDLCVGSRLMARVVGLVPTCRAVKPEVV